jgi:hypothetical protein
MIANPKTAREPIYPLRLTQDDVNAMLHRWFSITRVLADIRHCHKTGKFAGDFVVPEV